MPYDGNGTFSRLYNWVQDAAAAIKIKADRHDMNDDDLASGLSNCITKDGQTQPTNNLPMNGKKLINLGDPTNDTDAANKKYVDAVKTFPKGLEISGADAFGRLGFTSTTGVNGLSFIGADLGWFAKLADPSATPPTKNRLVLNDKADASGTDVIVAVDDGTLVAVKNYGKTEIGVKPASGLGTLAFYAADGTTVRAKMAMSSGDLADLTFTIGDKVNTFTTGGDIKAARGLYAAAALFNTDGNIVGTAWAPWGASDALTAISNRIEGRAQAWANDRVANLQYRKVSPGTGGRGAFQCPAGAVITGLGTGLGQGEVINITYHYLQVFDPVRGWVTFQG
jgi:hypothetical protein